MVGEGCPCNNILNSPELKCTQTIKLYHFVRIPFCTYHFVQYRYVSVSFCPYHFVRTILSAITIFEKIGTFLTTFLVIYLIIEIKHFPCEFANNGGRSPGETKF